MSRPFPFVVKLLSLALLVVAVGCAEQDTAMNEPDQSAINAADRIRELEEQLALAENNRIADQERLLQLQAELDQLRNQASADPAEGWSSVPGGAMTSIEGMILFDSGKANLKSSAKGVLKQVAGAINGNFAGYEIYVFGHTDDQPIKRSGWKDNYELSCQRALTVVRSLRSQGVAGQVAACGWGECRPATSNQNASERQANRRVEIFAMAPK